MPNRPLLDRAQLARIAQNVPQTIAGLEQLVGSVGGLPSTIEEANALAGSALAVAQAALAALNALAQAIAQLDGAPARTPIEEHDDTAPRAYRGTMAAQDADQVEITGGTAALGAFGCNGAAPQSAVSLGAAATDLTSAITLANKTRAALIANGIGTT